MVQLEHCLLVQEIQEIYGLSLCIGSLTMLKTKELGVVLCAVLQRVIKKDIVNIYIMKGSSSLKEHKALVY